jgi:tyrosyl-tRNA synthetase
MFNTLFNRINEDWSNMDAEQFFGFITAKSQEMLTADRLKELLASGRKLRIKLGTDATAKDLHIGHIVPLMLLRQFQKAGHIIDFIIGDFTGMVGDPSGREDARKALTAEEVKENAEGFTKQIEHYVNVDNMNIHFNSMWLSKMNLSDMLGHMQHISLSSATQREDFRKRLASGQSVSLAEVIYGFLMGLDSIHLKSDVELGGIDQLINIQQCRELMSSEGMVPEVAICTPIIEGTDGSGKKMSKSLGNGIPLNASHEEKFGKVMSIPDKLILPWFIAFTDVHESEIEDLKKLIDSDPLEAKKQLGILLIALETKSLEQGQAERENFERKFAKKELTDDDFVTVEAESGTTLFDALLSHFTSKSELRRLFEQNAVKNAGTDEGLDLDTEVADMKIKVGKRQFFRIIKK